MNPASSKIRFGAGFVEERRGGVNILSIDTSTKYLSLGVVLGGDIVYASDIDAYLTTSKIIIPTIDKVLKKLKVSLDDFDCFGIGLGPGSFTGLRIGASTIKAFSLCFNKKIIGIPSLDIIALNINFDGNICVVSDAKRNLIYSGFYKMKNGILKRSGEIRLLTINEVMGYYNCRDKACLVSTYFLGDGVGIYKDKIMRSSKNNIILDDDFWYPKAKNLCKIAIEKFKKQQFLDLDKLEPLYLYPKDCQIRK